MYDVFKNYIFPIISALADSCTFIIAIIAFVTFLKNRNKINLLLRFAVNKMQQDRLNAVKDTLSRLDSLNFDEKEHRTKIVNVFGTLCGQLAADTVLKNRCEKILRDLEKILKREAALNEHTKCRIVSEVRGQINNVIYDIESRFMEESNER